MFSTSVKWLLFVSSWQTLANALAQVTTVFVFTQNLHFSLADTSLLLTAMALVLGVYRIAVTPVLDELVSPWLPLAASAGVALGRAVLALQLYYYSSDSSGPGMVVLPLTLMAIAALQTLAGTSITLTIKRATHHGRDGADRARANAAQVSVYGIAYSFDNIASGGALLLFQMMKWSEARVTAANIGLVAFSAVASCVTVGLVVHVWPVLDRAARQHAVDQRSAPLVSRGGAWAGLGRYVRTRALWRLVSVNMLLLLASVGFLCNDLILPYVMMSHSTLGEAAPFTLVQLLNMVVVIVAAPLIQVASAHRVSNYAMLAGGTLLTALAFLPLVLADPAALWPYVVYMLLFSLAESTWAARLSAYNLNMAPKGEEATYMALVSGPTLAGGLLVRLGGGLLGDHFCPVGAPAARCAAHTLWGLALGVSLVPPLTLLVLRRWLDRKPPNVPDALQDVHG